VQGPDDFKRWRSIMGERRLDITGARPWPEIGGKNLLRARQVFRRAVILLDPRTKTRGKKSRGRVR